MKFSKLILIVFLLSMSVSAQSITNDWRGLIPLKSTRADVETLLGKPKVGRTDIYETAEEVVTLWYSRGTCKQIKASVWNVPKDTILGILFSPKKSLPLSQFFSFPNPEFEREADIEMRDRFTYRNKDSSVTFHTEILPNGTEDISFIAFAPSKADYPLRCSARVKKRRDSG